MGCLALSGAMLVAASVSYGFRWDLAYAMTVYPAWVIAAIGLATAAVARPKRYFSTYRWALLLWVIFTVLFSEEPRSILRIGIWPSDEWKRARADRLAVRVVSLNCGGGSARAAAEARSLRPDILLLQESPNSSAVRELAMELFGSEAAVAAGPDASILSSGPIRMVPVPRGRGDFVLAVVTLPSGQECLVASIRLNPPIVRFDYWNPDCWQAYAKNLENRRKQLSEIAGIVESHRDRRPLILGGDFNTAPTGRLGQALPEDLQDAFEIAGKGWGHTAINELPLVRIDQIWVSPEFEPDACFARTTTYSDHRMVVCDLIVDERRNRKGPTENRQGLP